MPGQIIFHIGLEKTGTTSFQRFCAGHRGLLARQGVLYPRFRALHRPDHAVLAAAYLAGQPRDYSITKLPLGRDRAVAAVKREIAGSEARTILLSAEHFSSRFDRPRAQQLSRDFAAYRPRILVVVRDPYARFLSAYCTAIESGGVHSLETYADEVFHPDNPYMDIARTLGPWQEAFGPRCLTLVDYDAEADIVTGLLRACGLDAAALGAAAAPRRKVSLDQPAILALRLCNVALRERQGDPARRPFPIWYQHTFFSKACRRELRRGALARMPASWPISVGAMARLDRIAETERRWLFDHCGVRVRGGSARERLSIVESPTEPGGAERLLARCLTERMTRRLWPVSELMVSAMLALGRPGAPEAS